MKTLESRVEQNRALTAKNTENAQVVYEYSTSDAKYTITPVFSTGLSILLLNIYSAPLVHLFGASSPFFFSLGFVYAGLKRMQWLRGGDRLIKGSTLVKKLTLKGDSLVVEDFKKKTHTLSLSTAQIHRIDSEARREVYYIIKDAFNTPKFILPISESALADEKTLNWFAQLKKANEEYSIRHLLSLGDKKSIDINRSKNLNNEIETLARMNILSSQGVELSTLSATELNKKLGSVSDIQVHEYLSSAKEQLPRGNTLESGLVAVENLLTSFGIVQEEAVKMTRYLRDNFKINGVKDLGNLTSEELSDAHSETVRISEVPFTNLQRSFDSFFGSLKQ